MCFFAKSLFLMYLLKVGLIHHFPRLVEFSHQLFHKMFPEFASKLQKIISNKVSRSEISHGRKLLLFLVPK